VSQTVTYGIDPSHSTAGFKVRHLMVSNVRGEFSGVSGTVVFDAEDSANSKVEAAIDATTIQTRDSQRDQHLKKRPISSMWRSSQDHLHLEKGGTDWRRRMEGGWRSDHPRCYQGSGPRRRRSYAGSERSVGQHEDWRNRQPPSWTAGISVWFSNMGALEAGGVMVGDEVAIELELELARQK